MTDQQNQYVVFVYTEKVERSTKPIDVVVRKMNPDQIREFAASLVKKTGASTRTVASGPLFNSSSMVAG